MKRLYLLFCFLFAISLSHAQSPTISMDGEVMEMTTDLDARAYFPKYDINDDLCALIKVTLTNILRNPLTLEVGGLGVVAREEKENGEIWFYVPAQVRNLSFKCATYKAPPTIPVRFREGTVYRITLCPSAVVETVTNAVLSSNYLKLKVDVADATVSLGRSENYELFSQSLSDGEFAEYLDYGTYFFKVEHPLYETYHGVVQLDSSTPKQEISLIPAFGYLDVNSTPEGAVVYLNGERMGVTPCQLDRPIQRGTAELRLELSDYYTHTQNVNIVGDGSRQIVDAALRPRFAEVTLECTDSQAEIWVDSQFKGVGSWSGRLYSTSKHMVETRREGHRSQSTLLSLTDGGSVRQTLPAPVPLYGSINVRTTPMGCDIQIDGKVVGETPQVVQVLVGKHEVVLTKEGYVPTSLTVEVEHNQVFSVNQTLQKGGEQTNVQLSCVDRQADIYLNGKKVGTGQWQGMLYEGEYSVEVRKAGCQPVQTVELISGRRRQIALPAPRRAFGTLTVEGERKSEVKIYSFDTEKVSEYSIGELNRTRIPIGEYEAYASKEGFYDSSKVRFTIKENEETTIQLPLAAKGGAQPVEEVEHLEQSESEQPIEEVEKEEKPARERRAVNRVTSPTKIGFEGTYDGAYVGAQVGWFFGKQKVSPLGLHASFAMGLHKTDFEFAAGPALRLGTLIGVESQLYAGVGYNHYVALMKVEGGLRLAYNISRSSTTKVSVSFGGTYISGNLYPKIGVGICWGK